MSVTVQSDGVLEAVSAKLSAAPTWLPAIYATHLPWVGDQIGEVMEGVLEQNRYSGALQDSITTRYDAGQQEVAVGPTALRGSHDAGTLLEMGVPHPVAAPWAPIKAWADARGIPAFPVWWTIRNIGIAEHPFLQRTFDDGQTQMAIDEGARRIVVDAATEAVAVEGVTSIGLEQR